MRKQNHWQILPGHPDRYRLVVFILFWIFALATQ